MKFLQYLGEFVIFRWIVNRIKDFGKSEDHNDRYDRNINNRYNNIGGNSREFNEDLYVNDTYDQSFDDFCDEQDDFDMM